MNALSKEDWIAEMGRLLCESQAAENDVERGNCHKWAAACYDAEMEACEGVEADIGTPQEAHDLELSYG